LPLDSGEDETPDAAPRWRYHPPRHAKLHDGLRLEDGSWLLVGGRGERWIAQPGAIDGAPRRGAATDAPVLFAKAANARLPETIRSVVRAGPKDWLLVGESGTVYACEEPLAPCARTTRPPTPLTRVVGGASGLIGLSPNGRVLRYRAGSGWARGDELPRRLFDVARANRTTLLGLAAPETLLTSRDGGLRWAVLRAPPIGAQRLVSASGGGVIVEGVASSMYWDGGSDRLTAVGDRLPTQLPLDGDWLVVPERGPRTEAVAERQAAVTGGHYYEAFESTGERIAQAMSLLQPTDSHEGQQAEQDPEGGVSRWLWASGALSAPLRIAPLSIAEPCDSVRLGAHERRVALACVHFDASGDEVVVDLHLSPDGGDSWSHRATLAAVETERVGLAVAGDGAVLLAGVCTARKGVCEPTSPLLLTFGDTAPPRQTDAPELVGAPHALVWSDDGSHAYFLGRRAKDDEIGLFLSRDGGRSFVSRALEPARSKAEQQAAPPWDLTELSSDRSLHPGADGTLGIVVSAEPPAYLVADGEGRISQVAQLPEDTLAVSGSGRWVFALSTGAGSDGDPGRLVAWESSDGGQTFRPTPVTPALRLDEFETLALRCSAAGCLVGDRASRIGWGHGDDEWSPGPAEIDQSLPPLEPAVKAPLDCELGAADWASIPDVAWGGDLPTITEAMRGESAWTLLRFDDGSGRVVAVHAKRDGANDAVHRQVLFQPPRRRSAVAYEVAPQMEGYAAARLSLPSPGAADDARRARLELAWVDYLHRYKAQGSLPLKEGLPEVSDGERPTLTTGLLSVSPQGLFVRPRPRSWTTYLVDRTGKVGPALRYPTWPSLRGPLGLQSDAVMGGGGPLAVALVRNEQRHLAAVGLARLAGADPVPAFATIAPIYEPGREVHTGFSYSGASMGVTVHAVDATAGEAWATFSPLDGTGRFGPARHLPTQLDLGPQPRPCTTAETERTPRLVAPFVPGTRHPVLVRSLSDSYVLLTDWAVLHGSQSNPCIAGWSARQLQRSPGAPMTAIIGGAPERSWLFRPTPGRKGSVDYRAMRCRRSPQSAIPRTIWLEAGAMRRRR
jgi:hypothetical protein